MNVHHCLRVGVFAVPLIVVGVRPAAAQHEGHQTQATAESASMQQVATCSQNSRAVTQTIEAANVRIEEARQTNSAAEMRSAVADLQLSLLQMKAQLAECLSLGAPPSISAMTGMSGMPRIGYAQPGQSNIARDVATPAPETAQRSAANQTKTPATTATQNSKLDISFKSQPTPVKIGENTFEVTVKGADGKPISDADVSVLFLMPAMPAMKMPEVRNSVPLKHVSGSQYRGAGQVMMAGQWEVTVAVKQQGKEIGTKKLNVKAQ